MPADRRPWRCGHLRPATCGRVIALNEIPVACSKGYFSQARRGHWVPTEMTRGGRCSGQRCARRQLATGERLVAATSPGQARVAVMRTHADSASRPSEFGAPPRDTVVPDFGLSVGTAHPRYRRVMSDGVTQKLVA